MSHLLVQAVHSGGNHFQAKEKLLNSNKVIYNYFEDPPPHFLFPQIKIEQIFDCILIFSINHKYLTPHNCAPLGTFF